MTTTTWVPSPGVVERSRLTDLCRRAGVADRTGLDDWSRKDPAAFWTLVHEWMGLRWAHPPEVAVDRLDDPARARWFPDARFSLVDNAVSRWLDEGRGANVALRWVGEDGVVDQMDYATLAAETSRVAAGLTAAGLRFGDRVGIQLSMTCEVAVVQLALSLIGAIAVPIFSGFGTTAVVDRLTLAAARALVVADGVVRRGRARDLRAQTSAVIAAVETLDLCITVPAVGVDPSPRLAGEVTWQELGPAGAGPAVAAPDLAADHPLMVAYTSGTTGAPKGVTLGTAGFCVKAGSDVALLLDVGPDDVVAWITDPGWVMHPITLIGGLLAGATVAMVDGAPDHPHPTRLWDAVDDLGITVLGVSPTLVRGLMGSGRAPGATEVAARSGLER